MANIRRLNRNKIGEILLHNKLITDKQLKDTLAEQKTTGELFGEIMVRRGWITEKNIAETIAKQFSLPFILPSKYYITNEVSNLIPFDFQKKNQIVPIDKFGSILVVATSGMIDEDVISTLEEQTKCTLQIMVTTLTDIKLVLSRSSYAIANEESKKAATQQTTAKDQTELLDEGKIEEPIPDLETFQDVNVTEALADEAENDEQIIEQLKKDLDKFFQTE